MLSIACGKSKRLSLTSVSLGKLSNIILETVSRSLAALLSIQVGPEVECGVALQGVPLFMSAHPRALPSAPPVTRSIQTWWSGLELSRKLDLVIALVLLPIALVTASLGGIATNVNARTDVTAQYRNTAFAVYDLRVALLNIQTGYRGYALSGNRSFLEPYRLGLSESADALQHLKNLQTFPQQIAALERSTKLYEVQVASNLELVKVGQALPSDLQELFLREEKRLFDGLRVEFQLLLDQALNGFFVTRQKVTTGLLWLSWLPWLAFGLLAAAALAVRSGLRQLILDPIRKLERAAQGLADGDGSIRLEVRSNDEMGKLSATFNQTAVTLSLRTAELQRSNRDLEQFAYVASHDLQEPLRMVSSYTQLLGKRYAGKLDERADTYIHYAVDGANRMQALIHDLLKYSRAGTRQAPLLPTSATAVVNDVLRSFELLISESGAQITVGELPEVLADRVQLTQIFQNLIGNALKFRREGVAHNVTLSAEPDDSSGRAMWRFTVLDNGIGIQKEYFERIFVIFQRLHTREAFSGSGIGLAICQRLIERHGGQIWLESVPDEGSAFHFTLQAVSPENSEQPEGGHP